jgi:hypothetical protein
MSCTLLAPRLLAASSYLSSCLGTLCTLTKIGKVRYHYLMHHGDVDFYAKDRIVQFDLTVLSAVHGINSYFRHFLSS